MESGKNLLSYETVISVSKKYSNLRLHPSLSICVGMKNVTLKLLVEDIDGTLERLVNDVLIGVEHHNGSKVR